MSKKKKLYVTFLPEDAEKYISVYWKYYISIEEEYLNVYSKTDANHYDEVRLYLAIGSEIDVVFKTICQCLDEKYNGNNINEHKEKLKEYIDDGDWDDYNETVSCIDGAIITPWNNTGWWTDYNNVKHKRTCLDNNNNLYFSHAEKSNITNALAGLYVLEKQLFTFMEGYLLYEYPELKNCKSAIFK